MQPKKRLNVHFSIPLWWPSLPVNWHAWLPTPGNVLFTLLVVGALLWAASAGALPLRRRPTRCTCAIAGFEEGVCSAGFRPSSVVISIHLPSSIASISTTV